MDDRLPFAPLHEQASLIAHGELRSLELTELYLDRIERYDGTLNAYIAVTAERALAMARAADEWTDAGVSRGPVHGLPLALKDLIDVAGLPTAAGSLILRENVAGGDATVARRLFEAGAVLLGKTHTVEFAFGGAGINHHYGTPWNPWDTEVQRLPGGSSSGSAVAAAAGLAAAAIGSDTGGSVRIPASFCGIVGLKPTFGRISSAGVLPLDPRLDSVGPLARCVADAGLLYSLLAGPDPADPDTLRQPPLTDDDFEGEAGGTRLCIPREYFWEDVDPEVEGAVRASAQVFADLGVHVDEVSMEELDRLAELRARKSLTAVQTYASYREWLEERSDDFDPIVYERMLDGRDVSAHEYVEISRAWEALRRGTAVALRNVDALLAPATPFAAPPLQECDDRGEAYRRVNALCLRNTSAANLLGLCSISLPCGFTRGGLPVGLMLMARPFEEAGLLRLARAYETAAGWSGRHPDLGGFE